MRYDSKLIVPILCPLQFDKVVRGNEKLFYPNQFTYIQKWVAADVIHVQIRYTTGVTDLTLVCRNQYGTAVPAYTFSVPFVERSIAGYYDAYFPMTGISGYCYFEILKGTSVAADSTWNESTDNLDTIEIIGHNNKNKYGVIFDAFQSSNLFSIRVEGGFNPADYRAMLDYEEFFDQHHQGSVSYMIPFDVHPLTLGDGYGLPWWMQQKVNLITALSVVLINNIQYHRLKGDMETTDTPFGKILKIDMSPTTNRFTQGVGGDIYITQQDSKILTDGEHKFIL